MATRSMVWTTVVQTPHDVIGARLLMDSLHTFGGPLRGCAIWLFTTDPAECPCADLVGDDVSVFSLQVPTEISSALFAEKVFACAQAEKMADSSVQSIVWMDPNCLVLRPPALFELGDDFDAAVRPVHIKNVGRLVDEPLDDFWKGIYRAVGATDIQAVVESFVGKQVIRAYFNSHSFSFRPGLGLMQRWLNLFERLVNDDTFQAAACADSLHRVFLFQALLSAILVTAIEPQRLRLLPPDYNYPYNLHASVPQDRRARALNDLVCLTYEGRTLDPALVTDMDIHPPFDVWLAERKGLFTMLQEE